jgi:DNA topoisomerase I
VLAFLLIALLQNSERRTDRATSQKLDVLADGFADLLAIQLEGGDRESAGRKQYLYHRRWREHRDRQKFDDMFDYPAKGGARRVQVVGDAEVHAIVRELKGRRGGPRQLLAYRDGEAWRNVRSEDINDYLREASRHDCSAKDFRTWNGTVLAAVALAKLTSGAGDSKTARKRVINEATKEVARQLGNTPTVCRRSYIDPRVFDRMGPDWTIELSVVAGGDVLDDDRARARLERGVLALLE